MTLDELCRYWEELNWGKRAMESLLSYHDLTEHYRTAAPQEVYSRNLRGQLEWLIHDCKPPFTPDELHDYLIDCQTP